MRSSPPHHRLSRLAAPALLATALCISGPASAQTTRQPPPTDSAAQASPVRRPPAAPPTDAAAQASPLRPASEAPATDSAAQASPVPPLHLGTDAHVAPHTAIPVRLSGAIDSGHLRNGDTVPATLAQAIALSPRGTLAAGTPVDLSVIETLPAGRVSAAGEFSLQLMRVGTVGVFTDTLTYRGQPGHKDLPDSVPAIGTDAALPSGAELTFHVLPPPVPAAGLGGGYGSDSANGQGAGQGTGQRAGQGTGQGTAQGTGQRSRPRASTGPR